MAGVLFGIVRLRLGCLPQRGDPRRPRFIRPRIGFCRRMIFLSEVFSFAAAVPRGTGVLWKGCAQAAAKSPRFACLIIRAGIVLLIGSSAHETLPPRRSDNDGKCRDWSRLSG